MKEFEKENLDMTAIAGWGAAMIVVVITLILLFQGLGFRYLKSNFEMRYGSVQPVEYSTASDQQKATLNDPEISVVGEQKEFRKVPIDAAKGIALDRLSRD